MSQDDLKVELEPGDIPPADKTGGADLLAGGSQATPHEDGSDTAGDDTATETPEEEAARKREEEAARIKAEKERLAAEKERLAAEVAASDKLRFDGDRLQVKLGSGWFYFDDQNVNVLEQANRTDTNYFTAGDAGLTTLDSWGTYKTDSGQVRKDSIDQNLRYQEPDGVEDWDNNLDALKDQVEADPNLRIDGGKLQIRIGADGWTDANQSGLYLANNASNVELWGAPNIDLINQWDDLQESKPTGEWQINLGDEWKEVNQENLDLFNTNNPDFGLSWADVRGGSGRIIADRVGTIPEYTTHTTKDGRPIVYYEGQWHYTTEENIKLLDTKDYDAFGLAQDNYSDSLDEAFKQELQKEFNESDILRWENNDGEFFAGGKWWDITEDNYKAHAGEDYGFTFKELQYFDAWKFNEWAATDEGIDFLTEQNKERLHGLFGTTEILRWDNRDGEFFAGGKWWDITEDNYKAHAGEDYGFTFKELQYFDAVKYNEWAETPAGKDILRVEYTDNLHGSFETTDLLRWDNEVGEFRVGGNWFDITKENFDTHIGDGEYGFTWEEIEYFDSKSFFDWSQTEDGQDILSKRFDDELKGEFETTDVLRWDSDTKQTQFYTDGEWFDLDSDLFSIVAGDDWDFTFDEAEYFGRLKFADWANSDEGKAELQADYTADLENRFGTTARLKWDDGTGLFLAGGKWWEITEDNYKAHAGDDYNFTWDEVNYFAGWSYNKWIETPEGKAAATADYTDNLHLKFENTDVLRWDDTTQSAQYLVDGKWITYEDDAKDIFNAIAGTGWDHFTAEEVNYYDAWSFNIWAETPEGTEWLQEDYMKDLEGRLKDTDLLKWDSDTRSAFFQINDGSWVPANEQNLTAQGWEHFTLDEINWWGGNQFNEWAQTDEGSKILQEEYTDKLHGEFETTELLRFIGSGLTTPNPLHPQVPDTAGYAQFYADGQWWDVNKKNVDIWKERGWDHFTLGELKYYESLEVAKRPGEVAFRANAFQDMIAPYTDMLRYDADGEQKISISIGGEWFGFDQTNYDIWKDQLPQGESLPEFSDIQHWGALQQHEIDVWDATKEHYNEAIEELAGGKRYGNRTIEGKSGNRFTVALAILGAEGQFKTFLTKYKQELWDDWVTSDEFAENIKWNSNPRNKGLGPRGEYATRWTLLEEALMGTDKASFSSASNYGGQFAIPIGDMRYIEHYRETGQILWRLGTSTASQTVWYNIENRGWDHFDVRKWLAARKAGQQRANKDRDIAQSGQRLAEDSAHWQAVKAINWSMVAAGTWVAPTPEPVKNPALDEGLGWTFTDIDSMRFDGKLASPELRAQIEDQRRTWLINAAQTNYMFDLRDGKVGIAYAMLNPRTAQTTVLSGPKEVSTVNLKQFLVERYGPQIVNEYSYLISDDFYKPQKHPDARAAASDGSTNMGDLRLLATPAPLADYDTIVKRLGSINYQAGLDNTVLQYDHNVAIDAANRKARLNWELRNEKAGEINFENQNIETPDYFRSPLQDHPLFNSPPADDVPLLEQPGRRGPVHNLPQTQGPLQPTIGEEIGSLMNSGVDGSLFGWELGANENPLTQFTHGFSSGVAALPHDIFTVAAGGQRFFFDNRGMLGAIEVAGGYHKDIHSGSAYDFGIAALTGDDTTVARYRGRNQVNYPWMYGAYLGETTTGLIPIYGQYKTVTRGLDFIGGLVPGHIRGLRPGHTVFDDPIKYPYSDTSYVNLTYVRTGRITPATPGSNALDIRNVDWDIYPVYHEPAAKPFGRTFYEPEDKSAIPKGAEYQNIITIGDHQIKFSMPALNWLFEPGKSGTWQGRPSGKWQVSGEPDIDIIPGPPPRDPSGNKNLADWYGTWEPQNLKGDKGAGKPPGPTDIPKGEMPKQGPPPPPRGTDAPPPPRGGGNVTVPKPKPLIPDKINVKVKVDTPTAVKPGTKPPKVKGVGGVGIGTLGNAPAPPSAAPPRPVPIFDIPNAKPITTPAPIQVTTPIFDMPDITDTTAPPKLRSGITYQPDQIFSNLPGNVPVQIEPPKPTVPGPPDKFSVKNPLAPPGTKPKITPDEKTRITPKLTPIIGAKITPIATPRLDSALKVDHPPAETPLLKPKLEQIEVPKLKVKTPVRPRIRQTHNPIPFRPQIPFSLPQVGRPPRPPAAIGKPLYLGGLTPRAKPPKRKRGLLFWRTDVNTASVGKYHRGPAFTVGKKRGKVWGKYDKEERRYKGMSLGEPRKRGKRKGKKGLFRF